MKGTNNSSVTLLTLLYETFWTLFFIFVTCEFGGAVSNAFDETNYVIAQYEWYLFPIDIRKMLR